MTDPKDDAASKPTAAETLAKLVAQRKAAARGGPPGAGRDDKGALRAAAALSASKSKPAMRKG
jgi:hypothetical protein